MPAPARRQQLLDVARELFARHGFHETSMEQMAEAAGVTKPVLYQHFRSKRALYRELLEDVGARMLAAVTLATERARTGRDQVEEGFAAYFGFVATNRAAFRLLFGASVRNNPEFAAIAERAVADVAEAIAPLIDVDTTPEQRLVLAHALAGMAEATSRRMMSDGGRGTGVAPEVLAGWLAEMAWYGLRGLRPHRPEQRAAD
jgi:AcrR family transcriptional regulator